MFQLYIISSDLYIVRGKHFKICKVVHDLQEISNR